MHLLIAWYVIKTYEGYQINKTPWGIHQMQNFTYANTSHEGWTSLSSTHSGSIESNQDVFKYLRK